MEYQAVDPSHDLKTPQSPVAENLAQMVPLDTTSGSLEGHPIGSSLPSEVVRLVPSIPCLPTPVDISEPEQPSCTIEPRTPCAKSEDLPPGPSYSISTLPSNFDTCEQRELVETCVSCEEQSAPAIAQTHIDSPATEADVKCDDTTSSGTGFISSFDSNGSETSAPTREILLELRSASMAYENDVYSQDTLEPSIVDCGPARSSERIVSEPFSEPFPQS